MTRLKSVITKIDVTYTIIRKKSYFQFDKDCLIFVAYAESV